MKRKNDFVIEQPCCGCIFFNECGTITYTTPCTCSNRITVEEFGHIPTCTELELHKKVTQEN